MCDAVTASMILQGGGAGLSAGSSYSQGRTEARVASVNADMARIAAADRLVAGVEESAALHREAARVLGAQRVAFSGNNLRLDVGAPLDVAGDTAREVSLASTAVRNNARRDAWRLRREALGLDLQGDVARRFGTMQAFGKLAGGGAGIFDTYKKGT